MALALPLLLLLRSRCQHGLADSFIVLPEFGPADLEALLTPALGWILYFIAPAQGSTNPGLHWIGTKVNVVVHLTFSLPTGWGNLLRFWICGLAFSPSTCL